jgi:zinc/manganese transport system substrate-binding protein
MEKKRTMILGIAMIVALVVVVGGLALYYKPGASPPSAIVNTTLSNQSASNSSVAPKLQVVAAENFWGSLVSQLGGKYVNVTSIVTDPNSDPHEYESNAADARMIANANFVIVNGVGYDDWALKLISASSDPNRTVMNVANLLGVANGSNPHLWYNPTYVNATVKQMYLDLVKIDPAHASYYKQQYANVTASLAQVDGRMTEIRDQFAGTKVAATESIFVYLANATGLDLISPPAFMNAVAEGDDPSAQSVVQFENQLESGNVTLLVYNEQTVTPITQQMKQIATQYNITIVGVTETIQPPDVPFQVWMNSELINLQNGLNANALGN